MKNQFRPLGVIAAGCLLGFALVRPAAAEVNEGAFNALKSTVDQMNQQMQELLKTHQQDKQQIQELRQKLGETQTLATRAVEKADTVAQAQATPVRNALHDFTMLGDAEVQFGQAKGHNGTFSMADFAPIFLYRANDHLLFEAGFDVTLQNNVDQNGNPNGGSSTAVELSFAQLDYLINDYLTSVSGYMLLPLGTYSERSAGWLNKIPDSPLAVDFLPGAGVGTQLRGGVALGEFGQQLTYSGYLVNGPSSTDGTARAGSLDLGGNVGGDAVGSPNLNGNPSGGGRISWFCPWKPNYDLELGVSGQSGTWSGNYMWSALVVDTAIHLSPYLEVKGEYIKTWQETSDAGTIQPQGWWIQAGYKLAGLNLDAPIVNDFELVERYDTARGYDADHSTMGSTVNRYTTGVLYYITNTLWLEGDYEWLASHNLNGLPSSQFIAQLSYGF